MSYGSSEIVDPDGVVLASAERLAADLVAADIEAAPLGPRRES
jgi:predicted amidohydrolase